MQGRKDEGNRLRALARMFWYFYSILCILFIGVIIADLLLVWGVGFSHGVTLYVNNFGEGFEEQLELLSVIPWITITFFRTVEDAARPGRKKLSLTKEELALFRKWVADERGPKSS
jgi:hypothetical protein